MPDFPTDWSNEFDALGEDEVRKRVAGGVWDAHKLVAARQWLEGREAAKGEESRRETSALAKEANDLAKKANELAKEATNVARMNNIIATLAFGVAVIALVFSIFLKR
jgi:hypothetical protein